MHLLNDKEINSSVKGSEDSNETQIIEKQSVNGSKSMRGAQTIQKTSTSSTDSCASSTDSGVIITDDTRTYSKQSNNNYRNLQSNDKNANNRNAANNCNRTSGTTSYDDSYNKHNNMNSANDNDKRRHSGENSKCNKNFSINNKIDKNNISIENVINIGVGSNRRQQRHSISSRTSSRNHSPTASIRSNTISIVSIDENAIDSSVVDSDSDYEGEHGDYIIKKLGQQTTYEPDHPNLLNINKGMQVLSQKISQGSLPPTAVPLSETLINGGALPMIAPPMSPNTAQIGSIALTNSTDVTFGDKHFYEGPVTIQQIVIDSRNKQKNGEYGGKDNPAYSSDGSDPENSTKPKYEANQPQGPLKFIFNRRAIIITGSIIMLTILAGIIIVTTSSHTKQPIRKSKVLGDGDDSRKHIPINSTIEPLDHNNNNSEYKFNGSLLIVSRDEWFAMAEEDGVETLKLPVPRVIIAHTASTICENKIECDARVQSVQAFHIHSQQWGDIGYNFLIGGDGLVYEGRGWRKVGAHTKGYNRDSIGIAFIGTFNEKLPTANDLKAAQLLIEEGVKLSILAEDYRLYGARQLSGTESPGKALYSAMCTYRVRMTQTLNIESQKYDDIIYNFLIGGDGNVYEGRGWDVTGAHLRGFNSNSISFAYIGTFKTQKPSEKQMNVTKLLLEEGVRLGKLSPDYKIYGAYNLDPTLTDVKADELYKSFKNWPHWTE